MKLLQACFIGLLAMVLAAGCARPPSVEMNDAIEAVARAENDRDAVTYASNLVTRARDALAMMHSEADSKRYDAARSYAAEAISSAERAITEGRAAAARARSEAASILADLPPLVEETEKNINAAKNAGLDLDFDSVDSGFSRARNDSVDAQFALSANRYQEAIALANGARANLNDINQRLSTAVMAVSRKK